MAMSLPGTLWDAALGSVEIFEMAMLLPVGAIAGVSRNLLSNGGVTAWHSVGDIAGVSRNLLSNGGVTAWHFVGDTAGVSRNLLSNGGVTAWRSGGNSVEV